MSRFRKRSGRGDTIFQTPRLLVEIERVVPRRRRKIVAALKLLGPESVDQLETEIEERGVLIQKARHTMLALQKMSLATFHY